MRKSVPLFLALVLVFCCAALAFGAAAKPKPKPKPKPAAKPAPKPGATVQLPGGPGKFGTVYSLRNDNPLYFRLVKAEYTTDQVVIGEQLIVPTATEKLLVLHFTVQNPSKTEQLVRWDSLSFTAVDTTDVNHDGREDWGDDTNGKSFSTSMKPAQTSAIFTVIRVPAKGIVPKLMVLPGENNGPVLRYDLNDPKNKVTPLAAPIADPADSSGYTALENVPGVVGSAYPYANFDITVEKSEYTTDELNGEAPEEEGRYFVITLLMKNESPSGQTVRWDTVTSVLTSMDGEELTYRDMLLATANRPIQQELKGKAEVRTRIYFAVPKDSTAKTLSMKEGESRSYEFGVQ